MTSRTSTSNQYRAEAEIERVVRDFEDCVASPQGFKHREHMVVALLYLRHERPEAALERMRTNLLRFLTHHGEDAKIYNETVTLFWLKRVQSYLDGTGVQFSSSLVEQTNRMLEECGGASLIREFYSEGRLASEEARTKWVDPDLRPLDF